MPEMIIKAATAEMTVDIITHVLCHTHQSSHAVPALFEVNEFFTLEFRAGSHRNTTSRVAQQVNRKTGTAHFSFSESFLRGASLFSSVLPLSRLIARSTRCCASDGDTDV